MAKNKTTIWISKTTKEKLDALKIHEREPYEDAIKKLLIAWEQTKVK